MRFGKKLRNVRPSSAARISAASTFAFEAMESRVLMSTTITAWNFNGLTTAVNWTPAPSTGSGTASSLGMSTDQTGASGPFPILENAAEGNLPEGPDASTIEHDTGSSDTATVTPENWKVVGTKTGGLGNGWNFNAPVGSQGAQFMVSTVGFNAITLQFDWGVSGFTANGQLAVEYTTNGGTSWLPAPAIALGSNENLAGDGDTVILTGSGPSFINGPYFQDQSDTGGNANDWQNGLTADFSSISAATNNPNFGVRLVNAATGSAAALSASGTGLPSQTSANWRFDDVQIGGTNILPTAPAITLQPTNQTVISGNTATFTAAASGFPAPTVQWDVSTNNGVNFSPISGATSTTLSFTTTSAQNNDQYEAIFSNGVGSPATTNAATLTVQASPVITTQPTNEFADVGTPVTFTAAASGDSSLSAQWQVSTNGGANFTNITGATSSTLPFTPTENQTGNEYQVIFTDTGALPTTSSVATLTVGGTDITQWDFTSGEAPPASGSTAAGTGNDPLPTLAGSPNDSAGTLGLQNDFGTVNGVAVNSFPESDVLPIRSTVNPNFDEFLWRVRGGSGLGPTGSPGSPDGWSQNAPVDTQGVVFMVNTTGYSNITLHFDWNQGGVGDMQAQYTPDGGNTWINVGSLIQATGNDYVGITSSTDPTGVLVNLQGITAANNNPNFGLRLVSAYDPNLPLITDGNLLDPTVHGQYASAGFGPTDAVQAITLGGSNDFTLTFNGQITADIPFASDPTTMAANIAAALALLTNINGAANVSVTPQNPIQTDQYLVTFNGTLKDTAEPTMTSSDPSATVATWVNGTNSPTGVSRFTDGSGSWQLGNLDFNGDIISGAPGISSQPVAETVTGGTTATFTASAYSELAPLSAQWQVSTNNGSSFSNIAGATNLVGSTSTFSFVTATNLGDNGHEFRAVFTNPDGSTPTQSVLLTVVAPVVPVITTQPQNVSVQVGNAAVFTADATGAPSPTVQWQVSTDGGHTFTDIPGATSTTLSFTSTQAENGDQYNAVFTNESSSVTTNTVILTVLANETVITDWDFSSHANSGPSANDNSPAPAIGTGVASPVGMELPFNSNDPATGIDGNGSARAADVVSSPGSLNANFSENTWRIRGGPTDANGDPNTTGNVNGGTPANGWSNFAPEYTQGVQFSVNTTGYNHVYVTMDWYATTSGILDAQEQYTIDGTNWVNINPQIQAVSNDFYGATATGGPVPLVIDVSAIPGASNDPNFGVRLVSAYNAILTAENGGVGEYANAALVGSPPGPAPYNGSKGNWRFDNIVIHGVPLWLDPSSQATWVPATSTLTVTGPSTIISDPGADEPIIVASGAAAQLTVNPTSGNQDIHIGGIELSGGASINVQPLGTGHFALVVGASSNANPIVSIDPASKLNLQSNDLIVHNGNLSAITGSIAAGYNGGTWNGNGIFSSTAAGTKNTELGVELNTKGATSFDGEAVTSADVLVVYTFDGAADFSTRSVDANDYITIDNGFVHHMTDFADGDFNYDGVINGDDYSMIDNAFNTQLAAPLAIVAPSVATNTAQIAKSVTTGPALIAQTTATAFDDADLKKRRTNVWVDLET
jgi:Immunoglobulin I-set domain/Immunoglobulin domain